jgi:Protein of unknown function/Domain of unknown function (DUF1835)
MRALHIVPGDSACGSLRQALRDAGRDEEVLAFRDDLSCGPIATDDPSERARWWAQYYGDLSEAELVSFPALWDRVAASEDRLVVWFGRHSASELAFFLAWTDWLGERPYEVIDVTGRDVPIRRKDGSPMPAVSIIPADRLRVLLGTERPVAAEQRAADQNLWRQLKAEDAPFRVVSAEGLVSAPINHFDALILEQASSEWQRTARVVGATLGQCWEPYVQAYDMMLHVRVVALVESGKLLAEGDPWDMRGSRVRLPS